ncbi:hypothetical protein QWT87_03570 [Chryseobacterium sp. APV1]|uniref:Lipoprotein SmpA/OmlA domain-containing protein n=2 Tax=Chryseobacterium TaxID=59732 RepID=A0A202C1X8_9FLAO|nr:MULTISPECIES: hypothetical protein [Chryseobacterium]MDO3423956.1 hypothetical protein [Chryseobacterium sp. APV1]OVE57711.1 hypothetical protein B0E34_08905 [Chryseobacterium mucoviscidosis]
MSEKYKYLIGKTKQEVISILGQEFNFYPSDHWSYELYTTWWGKQATLYLDFQNDRVRDFKINFRYLRF